MTDENSQEQISPNGDFHTHSNLTQTLNTIAAEHFKGTHKNEKGEPVVMPQFMAEALHMLFSNVAAAMNGEPFYRPHWENASAYCKVVSNIIKKAEEEQAAKKQEEEAKKIVEDAKKEVLESSENNADFQGFDTVEPSFVDGDVQDIQLSQQEKG